VSTINAVETAVYLYGITDAPADIPAGLPGIDGGEVEAIVEGELAAVVTRVARRTIRAQRSNLAAHHRLLRALVAQRGVLPCAFGIVAADEEQVRNVLRRNQDALAGQLVRLRGKVEMSLGVSWNTSNIFDFFVATNHELRELRDRVFRPGKAPSLDERMELGRLFESQLRQCRQRHTQQVVDTLSPYCVEIRVVDAGQEQMIMKLVCLLGKDQQERFEEGIQEAARKFDDHYNFKYSGPWAPFDFVDVSLDLS
jgi:hypothetical protein